MRTVYKYKHTSKHAHGPIYIKIYIDMLDTERAKRKCQEAMCWMMTWRIYLCVYIYGCICVYMYVCIMCVYVCAGDDVLNDGTEFMYVCVCIEYLCVCMEYICVCVNIYVCL